MLLSGEHIVYPTSQNYNIFQRARSVVDSTLSESRTNSEEVLMQGPKINSKNFFEYARNNVSLRTVPYRVLKPNEELAGESVATFGGFFVPVSVQMTIAQLLTYLHTIFKSLN